MSSSINLIGDKRQNALAPVLHQLRLLRMIAVSLLFLISASAMALYLMITLSPLPKLKQQEATEIANIAQYHPSMAKLQIVSERTNTIDNLLKKRTTFVTMLESVTAQMPADLSLHSYTLEKNSISVTVAGKSLSSINTFLDNLKHLVEEKKEFSKVIVSSLTTDKDNNTFDLTVAIVTKN